MADALTTPVACMAVGASGVALASCLPNIDLNAVICAFGGALAFVMWAKDMSLPVRLGYLLVGWIGGYYGAAEILAQAWTKTSGIAAFACGLLTVLISISILESAQTGELPKWTKAIPGLVGRLFSKRDAP